MQEATEVYDRSLRVIGKEEENEVVKFENIGSAGEKLKQMVPGVAVIDLDFTLKSPGYELGMGGKEPGRLPNESIELLEALKKKGWEVLVVTNQPRRGHQVARLVRGAKRADYPIFPGSVVEVVGEEGVEGGGWDFLWKKYKCTPEAVNRTAGWVEEKLRSVLGQIYFVGDRESDIDFAKKVKNELRTRGENRILNIWKVKGLELPGIFKHLEKFIP